MRRLLSVLWLAVACSRAQASPSDATPENTASATPIAFVPTFFFEGYYVDDACRTRPVVFAQIPSCEAIRVNASLDVVFSEPIGAHPVSSHSSGRAGNQLTEAQVTRLFGMKDGKCQSKAPPEVKVTPPNCTGHRACRRPDGTLECGDCEAPICSGSLLFVTFVEP